MAEQNKNIIIKRVKKVAAGHHGGSWKVAFADFMTALMAFFLLMWLLSMTVPEKKIQLAQYFNDFTVFSSEGTGLLSKELNKMTDMPALPKPKVAYLPQVDGMGQTEDKNTLVLPTAKPTTNPASPYKTLKKQIKTRLAIYKKNVNTVETEEGVRVDFMSLEDEPLFEIGQATLTPIMKKIIEKFYYDILSRLENKITIKGHSDAIYYANDKRTNWELSTGRASEVRRMFENLGFNTDRLSLVAGYASTRPLIIENPKDPRNRRISITLLDPKKIKRETTEVKILKLEE